MLPNGSTFHHYEIRDLLGSGGMGQVYRARDLRLNRTVAIKILPREFSLDPNRLSRFEQEARSASALNHPNIITIYDVGDFESAPYIAMEYVKGETLRDLLKEGALPLNRIQEIAIPLADGLAKAHEAGIVHRDLKPENIMITEDGYVKILDFGLAKLTTSGTGSESSESQAPTAFAQTETGIILGTVGYMSPEQARGRTVDFKSDQFSFGAILYEMITGQRAFYRPSIPETLTAIIREDPQPVQTLAPNTPALLIEIIQRLLAKETQNRYEKTREVVLKLRQLSQTGPVEPSIVAVPARRVSPLGLWKAFALLSVVLILSAFFLWNRKFAGDRPENRTDSLNTKNTIAVLPFKNLSGSQDEYLVDGITEAVITELANVKHLFVIARNSVFPFKGKPVDLKQIREELKVKYIVEGSVQRSGDQLRIQSQLIDVTQGNELWAKRYDRTLQNVFSLQDDIARNIAGALQIALQSPEESPSPKLTENREAYDAYLHGKYLMDREEGDATNLAAVQALERAVRLDPGFALAHASLAIVYRNRFFRHDPSSEWEQKAFVEVEKALALDPNLAEAYVARGRLVWTRSGGFPHEKAIRDFRYALSLNPNQAEAHRYLGIVLLHLGFFKEAEEESGIAQSLDPLNPGHGFDRTMQYLHTQRFELALKADQSAGERSVFRPLVLSYLGRHKEALEAIQPLLTIETASSEGLKDNPAIVKSAYAVLLAHSGNFKEAEENIALAIQKDNGFSHFHHAEYNIASAYAIMGKRDLAVHWLQKTAEHGFQCYPSFERDPNFASLRGYPPFQNLLATLKDQYDQYRRSLF